MKKFLILFSVFFLTAALAPASNSADAVAVNKKVNSIDELQRELVSTLKLTNPQSEDQLEQAIESVTRNADDSLLADYYNTTQSKTILPNTADNADLNLDEYVDDNSALGEFQRHEINNDLTIITTNSPVFFIHQTTVEDTPGDEGDFDTAAKKKKYKNTKTYSSSYTAKNFLNMKLFTVKAKGYFKYNGSDVKAKLNDAWYNKGFLSIWQVSNWKKGTYKKGKNYAELYGRGNFHFGLEIQGYGLVVQDQYIKVFLTANKKGSVWRKYSVK
ncbi:hypothetical protein ACQKEX_15100 [Bacillus pumilus]|uniref:hypothetical protein n=1 Tax=Bacillus TaxID=1386 RepID=UPI0009665873|nr:hypothetical protein [Bacillus pumilus]MBU8576475.1 hypothetical protein [Bacillus pumilus]OLP64325.1 hypothetical protein BACPU_25500 [Bacillus pumilus]